jgi:hypothetical protein
MRLGGHAFGSVRGLAPARDSVAGRYFALATLTPSSHNASMEETDVFTIDVAQDTRQGGPYRWSVSENMKVRDTLFYSFTTRREAQADAGKVVEKLKAVWRPQQ